MSSKTNANESKKTKRTRVCPMCKVEAAAKFYPFCSKRCEELDLHRWLSGTYAIPAVESDLPGDEDFVEIER